MEKKVPAFIKDGLIGMGIGTGIIIPGVSGATIALIFGGYKKIVQAVRNLLTKQFLRNFLILLPFGVGAIIAIFALLYPFQLAFDYCMFAIVCLFGAFIIGSIPGVYNDVKGSPIRKKDVLVFILTLLLTLSIGVMSLLFNLDSNIEKMFIEHPWYLYVIIFFLGILCASGITVPGFSASMLLLVTGFYKPIINIFKFQIISEQPGHFFGIVGLFFVGVLIGFFLFSIMMNHLINFHRQSTYYGIIGLLIGSVVSIFVNDSMFRYLETKAGIIDWILAPIFFVIGLAIAILILIYSKKRREVEEEQEIAKNS